MAKVLLVEDDEALAETLALALGALGHDVAQADTGDEALKVLLDERANFDVLLLDVMLPGPDGFEVCRRLRAHSMLPTILLTARGDPIDVVAGLEVGADDYVVKPVQPRVLDARIKALLRRAGGAEVANRKPVIAIGHLRIDPAAMTVTRDGEPLQLTTTELKLLVEFARNPDEVLSRKLLLERVWEYGYLGDSRIVDTTVARLRAKIDRGEDSLIRTVRGFGYRLESP
ncbi:response regulator transcription factor [Amycolatopsis magusensis]|uniref:response regulator transcription factor n=1 Tax=Amycolatopsis magusensis TaxID=882444 RepID=UPI0024A83F83|nr:response regulator transcription factor [Amycolatopsis magusensis]MDI5979900.1 response regulator transcription factor [Amycolatopsis magusensis]